MSGSEEALLGTQMYEILDACTNDELEPLVEVLLKSPESTLNISRVYQLKQPDHSRYTDQIGDEIFRLAVAALGRDECGGGDYSKIVTGLCKKLGVAVASTDDVNEANLLNLFSRRALLSVSASEQQAAVNEACLAASEAAGSIWRSAAWQPLAACVLHIGHMRQRLVATGRIRAGGETALAVDDGHAPAAEAENMLVIKTEDDRQVLAVSTYNAVGCADWKDMRPNDRYSALLTPALKALEPLLSAERILSNGNYARVTIPRGAELIFSEKHSSFIGAALDANKKFTTVLLDPVSLASIASPAILLNLATAMAEQKRLEDISRKLTEIKEAVDSIARFQSDERRSALTGSIRYFRQIAESVLSGDLSDEVLHVIEHHEAELVRLQDHLAGDIRVQVEATRKLKDESRFSTSKYVQDIREQQGRLDALYRDMMLCIRARACGLQLLWAFPGRERRKDARLEEIIAALEVFGPRGELAATLDTLLREKIQSISSIETRLPLLQGEHAFISSLDEDCMKVRSDLESYERPASLLDEPLSLDLQLENGSIVAARML